MHQFHIGLGSNLGDRKSNILAALQRLRAKCQIASVSSFYETELARGGEDSRYLNVAAALHTDLDMAAFKRFITTVQASVARTSTHKGPTCLVDINVLSFDQDFVFPDLSSQPFPLIPLAEIAVEFQEQAASLRSNSTHRKLSSIHYSSDHQSGRREINLSLSRVGVARVRRIVHLIVSGKERTYNGEFTIAVDLAPEKASVHMSRFSEFLGEATLDALDRQESPLRIEILVERIARDLMNSQQAIRADVRLRADFGLERWTPVSGKRGEETYTLIGIAHADHHGSKHVVGVEAEGMTACPCAQLMIREHSLRELQAIGFSSEESARALDALPVATHNQRGKGSILLGVSAPYETTVLAEDLVEIVETSMSSETYDLLKRPDEFFVVNKAHQNPKFVEDVVRGILARSLDTYAEFPDDSFIAATQVNYESIHKHDAFGEAFGTFGEFRSALSSITYGGKNTDLATWLGTRNLAAFS